MAVDGVAMRSDAVLVVIDEQERLTAAMGRREPVLKATERLLRVAALVRAPVIVTRQYPKGLGDTDIALGEAIVEAKSAGVLAGVIDKVAFDCFGEPAFVKAVRDTGRRQLVFAGMETHVCIVQTALAALREGLDVHVIADACCSRDDANHELALGRLRRAGAVVSTSESAMYELVGEAGTEEFRSLLRIVKGQPPGRSQDAGGVLPKRSARGESASGA